METDWAENRTKIAEDGLRNLLGKVIDSLYSTPERDKFRTRFEPGTEPGTTDIFISHRGMYGIQHFRGQRPDSLAAARKPIQSLRQRCCGA